MKNTQRLAWRRPVWGALIIGCLVLASLSCNDNKPPALVSSDQVEATGGIYFSYVAKVTDPDGPALTITFANFPSWAQVDTDSLFGTPPDRSADSQFVVIASDGFTADTMIVTIHLTPCLVIYGDTRSGHDAHRRLVEQIRNLRPLSIFHVGDLVADGTVQADWDTFNVITSAMRTESEFFPALGNHDKQSPVFFSTFDLPGNEQWYSVERNRVHFIVLNTCADIALGSEQYQWLESDLASVPDSIAFIMAVFHHPPYSTGRYYEDKKNLRGLIVPLFEQYGVDVAFSGHEHSYERSYCGGRYYIVTGGGGAPFYDQASSSPCSQLFLKKYEFCKLSVINDRAIIRVYSDEGQMIDSFEVNNN